VLRQSKEIDMKNVVGLWIDHRKASLVFIVDNIEESKIITSGIETQGGQNEIIQSSTIDESQRHQADDSRERDKTGHLNKYYDEVILNIREAEEIFIFGPGEAKGELKKRIENKGLIGNVVQIETIDKMTEPQISAKVRNYFKGDKHSKRK